MRWIDSAGFAYQLGFTGIYGLYSSTTDGGLIHSLVQQQGVAGASAIES
jgi:hypothetical protein